MDDAVVCARPRIVTVAPPACGALDVEALVRALAWRCDLIPVDAGARGAGRRIECAVRDGGAELVHLFDPSLFKIAERLRRTGVSLTATLSRRLDDRERKLLPLFDEAFLAVDGVAGRATHRFGWPPVTFVPPVAAEPRLPSPAALKRVSRALRGVEPGRFVIGALWPVDMEAAQLLLDGVLPALQSKPVCLLVGAPGRREVRRRLGGRRTSGTVRTLHGPLTLETIAAAAHCVDVWIAPEPDAISVDEILAMAASGAPLVAGGTAVLEHEKEAFVTPAGEPHALAPMLDRLLALPPTQRHWLGVEFARATLRRWPPDAAAEAYAARFASLVGRPAIPRDLRAIA
jgi:hypothetical protein